MPKTATYIRQVPEGSGDRRLYRLSEPLKGYESDSYEFVVVSAIVCAYGGPETFVFGASESGNVLNWCELDGSQRGVLDHRKALEDAGYEVVS